MSKLFILPLCLVIASALHGADQPPFSPSVYAFQNGLHSASAHDGARLLKELGYPGVGSVYPKDLANLKAAYDEEGLQIFSIYASGKVHADSYQIDKYVIEAIRSLKGTKTLREIGFQGPIGLQCYNIKIDSRQHLERSRKAWNNFIGVILSKSSIKRLK